MRRPFWLFSFTCRRPTGYTIFWQLYLKEYLLCVLLDPTLDGKYYSLALKWEIFYNSCSTVHLDLHRSLRCSRWGILWNKISTLTLPRSIWFLFSWTTSISYFLSTLCSYNKIRIKAAAHNIHLTFNLLEHCGERLNRCWVIMAVCCPFMSAGHYKWLNMKLHGFLSFLPSAAFISLSLTVPVIVVS